MGKKTKSNTVLVQVRRLWLSRILFLQEAAPLKQHEVVAQAGAQPLAVLTIFSYQLDKATQAFEEAGVELQSLSNYTALMNVALREGTIQEEEMELLRSWRQDPASFGK